MGPHIFGEGLDINRNNEILTASWRKDSPLQLWDYGTGDLIKTVNWTSSEKGEEGKGGTQLYCCKFSSDYGNFMFAGGSQVNQARIFDYEGSYVGSLKNFSHACVALDCSKKKKDGSLLAVAGGEGAIRLVSIKDSNNE